MELVQDQNFMTSLVVGILVGGVSGYVGSFMILRRMALVGDALSHVALPGMGLALLWSINPFVGAFGFLVVGVLAIWFIETRTKLPTESLVGIIFTLSLAIGFIITPEPELIEALFGNIQSLKNTDIIFTFAITLLIFAIMYRILGNMMLMSISEDMAKANGVKVERIKLVYLLLVAAVVALGIKVAGTLLMGALVIIPAATSKNTNSTLRGYTTTALVLGVLSAAIGLVLSQNFDLPPGPLVVLTSIGFFILSLFMRR